MVVQHRLMATPNVDIQRQLVTVVHLLTKHLLLNCKMVPNARIQHRLMATLNVDMQRQLVTLVHLSTKHLLLNCKTVPNARTTSPDSYSECGYAKATSDT